MRSPNLPDIERQLADLAARAHLRLRFDKVALRVIGNLRASLAESVPDGKAVLFTISAPIKRPAKTVAAMRNLVQGGLPGTPLRESVHGNDVRLRWIEGVQARMPKAIGFIHNPESNAERLLDLAEARLTASELPHPPRS